MELFHARMIGNCSGSETRSQWCVKLDKYWIWYFFAIFMFKFFLLHCDYNCGLSLVLKIDVELMNDNQLYSYCCDNHIEICSHAMSLISYCTFFQLYNLVRIKCVRFDLCSWHCRPYHNSIKISNLSVFLPLHANDPLLFYSTTYPST